MKRNPYAYERDARRRAQRFALLSHDVPTLAVPAPSTAVVSPNTNEENVSSPALRDSVHALVDERLGERLPAMLQAHAVGAHAVESSRTVNGEIAHVAADEAVALTESHDRDAQTHDAGTRNVARLAATPEASSASSTAPRVRVVSRKQISAKSAEEDHAPSLARPAKADRDQAARAARCLAHAGQHYRGATETDVIDAWQAMRERFHVAAENKIVARRALLQWLQRNRNVCANNVHWYGDLVAVRSCHVRVPVEHPGHGVDGWFILFDPNGDGFLRAPLFAEAFETSNGYAKNAAPRLVRPAWLSEETRERVAAMQGEAGRRAFSPETADALTADDFFRGRAE